MRPSTILLGLIGTTLLTTAIGCGDDTSATGGAGGSGGSSTTGSSSPQSGSTSAVSSSSSSSSASSTSSGTGGGTAGDHLLISEIVVGGNTSEFIEIWNPTSAEISLADYYLSDNSTYVDLASGGAWQPITNNPGTDFLARFPANATIPADGVIVVAFDPGYETDFGSCPDYFVATADVPCGISNVPALLETEPGSIMDTSNISNDREMVVLFTWSGSTSELLEDVDYVTWGTMFEPGTRADKSAVAGYQPDTPVDMQSPASAPAPGTSIERCAIETGETTSGGNGITDHDETSEDLGASFVVQAAPTPGVKNACL
jgi:hypothetical protein